MLAAASYAMFVAENGTVPATAPADFQAGVFFGFAGTDVRTLINECFKPDQKIADDTDAFIAAIKAKDWANVKGIFAADRPQALDDASPCTTDPKYIDVSDAYDNQVHTVQRAMDDPDWQIHAAKSLLPHRADIKAGTKAAIDNWDAGKWYEAGVEIGKIDALVFAYWKEANAAPAGEGTCDNVEPLAEEFDLEKYMGLWYRIQHSESNLGRDYMQCFTTEYDNLNAKKTKFNLFDSYVDSRDTDPTRTGRKGKADTKDLPNGEIDFYINNVSPDKPNYIVMETDYDSYAMVYGCGDGVNRVPNLWILSRTPTMDDDLKTRLNASAWTRLPNYDWSLVRYDTQGDPTCTGTYTEKWDDIQ